MDFRISVARAHCTAPAGAVRVTSSLLLRNPIPNIKLTSCFPPLDTAFFPSPCPRATPYGQGRGGLEARAASDESYVSAWHSDGGAHPRIKNNHKSALLEFFFGGDNRSNFISPHSSLPFTFTFCYHYYCQLADHDLT